MIGAAVSAVSDDSSAAGAADEAAVDAAATAEDGSAAADVDAAAGAAAVGADAAAEAAEDDAPAEAASAPADAAVCAAAAEDAADAACCFPCVPPVLPHAAVANVTAARITAAYALFFIPASLDSLSG